MTKRVMRVPAPSPPLLVPVGLWEGGSPGRQPWSSVPACGGPVGPGVHWEGWCYDARIRVCARKWTDINHPLRGLEGHQGTHGWQGQPRPQVVSCGLV
jgi:hypothetical protein